MKNFFLFLIALVVGAGAIAIAYPAISPYHARLRAQITDPAKREAAVRTAIDFEKLHIRAMTGDKEAQYRFGLTLTSGELGFRDTTQAAAWFARSAAQDYPPAEFAMALACLSGDGVAQDDADGAAWAEKSDETKAVPQSRELMGLLYAGGIGEQQDLMKGLDLLKTARSSEALAIAQGMDAKFKEAYALPKEQRDAALQQMADAVKTDIRAKFPAMRRKMASDALGAPPSAVATTR